MGRGTPHFEPVPADKFIFTVIGFVLLAALIALLVGCSQTRTVTVPAGQSTVNAVVPDTIEHQELPPPEPPGPLTRPKEVVVYADTPDWTVDLSMIEVDRTDPNHQTVTVRAESGGRTVEQTLALPAVGEALRGTADSTGLQWSVPGAPTEWDVEGYVSSYEPPWWRRLFQQGRLAVAFAGGLIFGFFAGKLFA